MSGSPIVVVGDVLLDRDLDGVVERLCPDAPVPVVDQPVARSRPGGAGLAAALAAWDGRSVILVTALGDDEAGAELGNLLKDAGVAVVNMGLRGSTPEKIRVRAAGRSLLRIDQGGHHSTPGRLSDDARHAIADAGCVLVADYGRGVAAAPDITTALLARRVRVPLVWDPHPKGAQPAPGVALATPNREEAARFSGLPAAEGVPAAVAQARALVRRWQAPVAVTLGDRGAVLVQGDGPPLAVPAAAAVGDPCGAGDRFASTAAELLADGALVSEAVVGAVSAASSFVAAGGASALPAASSMPERGVGDLAGSADAFELARRVRAEGGTVVATGGCFDMLHAGHLSALGAARRLGDCLIVCLNSDSSVRDLKGPERPVVNEHDRRCLLEALACVDAVVVFEERTPEAVLARLRPHLFVKGGDYGLADLPEASLLAGWDGQVAIVPYLQGRSSSQLIEEVSRRGIR